MVRPKGPAAIAADDPSRVAHRPDPPGPHRIERHIWCPQGPRRADDGVRRHGGSQRCGDAHVACRDRWPAWEPSTTTQDAWTSDGPGSRRPPVHEGRTGRTLGDRHNRTPDQRREGLLRCRPRHIQSPGRGLVDRLVTDRHSGHVGVGDGNQQPEPDRRDGDPFRSGDSRRIQVVVATPQRGGV